MRKLYLCMGFLLASVMLGLTWGEVAFASEREQTYQPTTPYHSDLSDEKQWLAIETALQANDWATARELLAIAPQPDVAAKIEARLGQSQPANTVAPANGLGVGINGAGCAYGSITAAVAAATDGDTIYVTSGTWNEQLGAVNTSVTIVAAASNCTIEDPAATRNSVIIDGGGASGGTFGGIIEVQGASQVTFRHVTLREATANYGGIAYIGNSSELTLDNAGISDGTATLFGGCVRGFTNSVLRMINDSVIFECETTGIGDGGAVALNAASAEIRDFSDIGLGNAGGENISADLGGNLFLDNSTVDVYDSFINNGTAVDGGGIYALDASQITLHGVSNLGLFSNSSDFSNEATNGGGAYLAESSILSVMDSAEIEDNSASANGGGAYLTTDSVLFVDTGGRVNLNSAASGGGVFLTDEDTRLNMPFGGTINDNSATGDGGGIYLTNSSQAYLDGANILDNQAGIAGWGGGIFLQQGITMTPTELLVLDNSLISGNSSNLGGGLYLRDNTPLVTIADSTIFDNSATTTGGGMRIFDPTPRMAEGLNVVNLRGSVVEENSAATGAGIAVGQYAIDIHDTTIFNNTATGDGGGLYVDGGSADLTNTLIHANVGRTNGGGIAAVNNSDIDIDSIYQAVNGLSECPAYLLPANTYCSEIRSNTTSGDGGGIYLVDSSADINNTAFLDNTGTPAAGLAQGSALYQENGTVLTANLLLAGNNDIATYIIDAATFTGQNNTWVDNGQFAIVGGSANVTINLNGNILWDNGGGHNLTLGTVTTTCNNAEPGIGDPFDGLGDISADPQFITTFRGDYRLGAGSPSINQCAAGEADDLDGGSRPQSAIYDMGAFEFGSVPTAITLTSTATTTHPTIIILILITLTLAAFTIRLHLKHLNPSSQSCTIP